MIKGCYWRLQEGSKAGRGPSPFVRYQPTKMFKAHSNTASTQFVPSDDEAEVSPSSSRGSSGRRSGSKGKKDSRKGADEDEDEKEEEEEEEEANTPLNDDEDDDEGDDDDSDNDDDGEDDDLCLCCYDGNPPK